MKVFLFILQLFFVYTSAKNFSGCTSTEYYNQTNSTCHTCPTLSNQTWSQKIDMGKVTRFQQRFAENAMTVATEIMEEVMDELMDKLVEDFIGFPTILETLNYARCAEFIRSRDTALYQTGMYKNNTVQSFEFYWDTNRTFRFSAYDYKYYNRDHNSMGIPLDMIMQMLLDEMPEAQFAKDTQENWFTYYCEHFEQFPAFNHNQKINIVFNKTVWDPIDRNMTKNEFLSIIGLLYSTTFVTTGDILNLVGQTLNTPELLEYTIDSLDTKGYYYPRHPEVAYYIAVRYIQGQTIEEIIHEMSPENWGMNISSTTNETEIEEKYADKFNFAKYSEVVQDYIDSNSVTDCEGYYKHDNGKCISQFELDVDLFMFNTFPISLKNIVTSGAQSQLIENIKDDDYHWAKLVCLSSLADFGELVYLFHNAAGDFQQEIIVQILRNVAEEAVAALAGFEMLEISMDMGITDFFQTKYGENKYLISSMENSWTSSTQAENHTIGHCLIESCPIGSYISQQPTATQPAVCSECPAGKIQPFVYSSNSRDDNSMWEYNLGFLNPYMGQYRPHEADCLEYRRAIYLLPKCPAGTFKYMNETDNTMSCLDCLEYESLCFSKITADKTDYAQAGFTLVNITHYQYEISRCEEGQFVSNGTCLTCPEGHNINIGPHMRKECIDMTDKYETGNLSMADVTTEEEGQCLNHLSEAECAGLARGFGTYGELSWGNSSSVPPGCLLARSGSWVGYNLNFSSTIQCSSNPYLVCYCKRTCAEIKQMYNSACLCNSNSSSMDCQQLKTSYATNNCCSL